jgi:hypothetical protein
LIETITIKERSFQYNTNNNYYKCDFLLFKVHFKLTLFFKSLILYNLSSKLTTRRRRR